MTSVISIAHSSSSMRPPPLLDTNDYHEPPSPSIHSNRSPASSSSSVSTYSPGDGDATIIGKRVGSEAGSEVSSNRPGLQKTRSQEDLRILAISTHITELSYAISDIQTRIFEIQELRHKSQAQNAESSSPGPDNVTAVIDKSLVALDERLETVEKGIKSVNENMQPYSPVPSTPATATPSSMAVTPTTATPENENTAALIRKHTALVAEWEAVQDESDVLREELKEDKWLTVFRTVTDQADGMMSSLEKAVARCQDFIFQVHQRKRSGLNGGDDLFGSSSTSKGPITLDAFDSLLESYEAKKKHYMPATSKVLSIIDRGVRDRVTKNGETLRRHSESAQRWTSLRDRIARTDTELENVRKILLAADAGESEAGSSTSGYLATPPSVSRTLGSEKSGISRSISPFRKLARRIRGSDSGGKANISNPTLVTPLSVNKKVKTPASEPPPKSSASSTFNTISSTVRKQRTSLFPGTKPATPDRPGHKHSQSATPGSSPQVNEDSTGNQRSYFDSASASTYGRSRTSLAPGTTPPSLAGRPTWNSSTKVSGGDEKRTPAKGTPSRPGSRPPSSTGMYNSHSGQGDIPPVPPLVLGTPGRRSLSRASMTSGRPWSPISSSYSSSQNHGPPPPLSFSSTLSGSSSRYNTPSGASSRPPSRARTPSRNGNLGFGTSTTPKPLPKTPSGKPLTGRSASVGNKVDMFSSESTGDLSPTFSSTGSVGGGGGAGVPYHPPRPPSRSMIPVPTVHVSGTSPGRASSSMSHVGYGYAGRAGSESPTMRMLSKGVGAMSPFKVNARRSQTPDMFMMRSVSAATGGASASGTGSLSRAAKLPPPSSFRDGVGSGSGSASGSGGSASRPGSRSGLYGDANLGASTATLTGPLHEYVVENPRDPLDVEVGRVVNGIAHGMKVERVDPPLKKVPKEGEEVKAQYSLSNALGTKVVTCRLSTMTRATKVKAGTDEAGGSQKDVVKLITTKKVMCRVGGGWQDLGLYISNRQAGL